MVGVLLAMNGCSSQAPADNQPLENYSDGEGDGGGVVVDPGPEAPAEAPAPEETDAGPAGKPPRPSN
ncbi:MAG: hypothetical protein ABIP39_14280, partial [Polyangiaceae bacterium]